MIYPVFVYGTLKSGHSRSQALRSQRYLGTAVTDPLYKMYRYSSFPAMVNCKEDGMGIFGEVYEVSDSCLSELDDIEGTKHSLFARGMVSLQQINFVSLPLYKKSSDMLLNNKQAVAYFFVDENKLSSLKDCGQNWTIME